MIAVLVWALVALAVSTVLAIIAGLAIKAGQAHQMTYEDLARWKGWQ